MFSNSLFASFHFQQPLWLLLFPLLLGMGYLWKRSHEGKDHWSQVCDPELLPILLSQGDQISSSKKGITKVALPVTTLIVSALLAVAAAQPVWKKQPVPAFKQGGAVVIALDLSASMLATDLKPTRLQRARFKIEDLIQRLPDSQIALLVYAGDAFAVTPLTQDTNTILAQLPVMEPSIMPAPGNRADIAIRKANDMLTQAGIQQGNILLVSDEVDTAQVAAQATSVAQQGRTLSILAVGTQQGAPIPTQAGPMRDNSGQVIVARTDVSAMREAAALGGGSAYQLVANDSDITQLVSRFEAERQAATELNQKDAGKVDIWIAEGPWFALLALPFLLPLFRRGFLNILLPAVFISLMATHVSPVHAGVWQDLWQTPDQQAQEAFKQGDKEAAAQQFLDPRWKQVAEYESSNYEAALNSLTQPETATDWYNRGNILAKMGDVDSAIDAYNNALALLPDFEDAAYNKEQLEKLKEQQKQQQDQQQDASGQNQQGEAGQQNQEPSNSASEQQNSDQASDSQEQQSDEQPGEASSSSTQASGNSDQQPPQTSENSKAGEEAEGASGEQEPAEPQPASEQSEQALAQQQQQASEYLKEQVDKVEQGTQEGSHAAALSDTQPIDESEQARQQLINRIVDDPAGLWRRKFLYQYRQDEPKETGGKTW
ncbi:VWA domain-containing protein [Neptunomonas phycophila]|uniref:VWA domain-containing protein n=1 Tax=Neptunomonas phycophila TaxID=1572645 RepID=UPI0015BE10F7|nr:VWA domain-containing protein [Neptunomonas phycophila]QLE97300.1 VWA domain-containing protein [Neptunomonas phycophila]